MPENELTPEDYQAIFEEFEELGYDPDLRDTPSLEEEHADYESFEAEVLGWEEIDSDELIEEEGDPDFDLSFEPELANFASPTASLTAIGTLASPIWLSPKTDPELVLGSRSPESEPVGDWMDKFRKLNDAWAKWIMRLLLEFLLRRAKIDRWLKNPRGERQDKFFDRVIKGDVKDTDKPLGPNGPEFGPKTAGQWKWDNKGDTYDAKLDLSDEIEKLLKKMLGALFAAIASRIGRSALGKTYGEKFGQNLAASLQIKGWVETSAVWNIRFYYDVRRKKQAYELFNKNWRKALKIAYSQAGAQPPRSFGKGADIERVLRQQLTPLVNVIGATFSDPAKLIGMIFDALRDPKNFTLPDVPRIAQAADDAKNLFRPLNDEGFRCSSDNPPQKPNRQIYHRTCMRLLRYGPMHGPGAYDWLRKNHMLYGAYETYPVEPINYQIFPPNSPVFIRNIGIDYKITYLTDFPTNWGDVVKDAATKTVKDMFEDLKTWAKDLPKKGFKKIFGQWWRKK